MWANLFFKIMLFRLDFMIRILIYLDNRLKCTNILAVLSLFCMTKALMHDICCADRVQLKTMKNVLQLQDKHGIPGQMWVMANISIPCYTAELKLLLGVLHQVICQLCVVLAEQLPRFCQYIAMTLFSSMYLSNILVSLSKLWPSKYNCFANTMLTDVSQLNYTHS